MSYASFDAQPTDPRQPPADDRGPVNSAEPGIPWRWAVLSAVVVAVAGLVVVRVAVSGAETNPDTADIEGSPGYSPVEAHRFDCDANRSDAFTTASGIELDERYRWLVDRAGRVVDSSSNTTNGQTLGRFVFSFTNWIERENPEAI